MFISLVHVWYRSNISFERKTNRFSEFYLINIVMITIPGVLLLLTNRGKSRIVLPDRLQDDLVFKEAEATQTPVRLKTVLAIHIRLHFLPVTTLDAILGCIVHDGPYHPLTPCRIKQRQFTP